MATFKAGDRVRAVRSLKAEDVDERTEKGRKGRLGMLGTVIEPPHEVCICDYFVVWDECPNLRRRDRAYSMWAYQIAPVDEGTEKFLDRVRTLKPYEEPKVERESLTPCHEKDKP